MVFAIYGMQFREWLLIHENIIVNTGSGEAVLGKSRENNNVVEFSYDSGEYYSSFEVWPFSEERPGYVKLSDGVATVVGIIKKTPIEAGNGADRAFIKSLSASLAASGLKPLPYKEGDSAWMGALSAAGVDDDHPAMKGMKGEKDFSATSTPEMGKASSNAKRATAGMSFGKMSGSWAYFIRVNPGSATYQIDKIVGAMKQAAKPLIDNDIIDQYRIVKGWNYNGAEVVWSAKGKSEHEDESAFIKKASSQMKFLANTMLANHPKAKEMILKYFRNSWDKDTEPTNTGVRIEELKKYVKSYHNESLFLDFFLDAVAKDNDDMYDVLERAANTNDPDNVVYVYKQIANEDYDYLIEHPRLYMNQALDVFAASDLLSSKVSGNFERFKREYEDAVNRDLSSGGEIRPYDLELLKKLSEYIDIKAKGQIEDLHGKMKTREEEQKKKNEDEAARFRERINKGDFKYMIAGDSSWKPIPPKYLDGDEVEVGEMATAEDIVDKEEIFHSAHEKASEEAWEDAEQRKSETYGEDKDEVNSDIDYEWDDYIEDRFSDGEWEGVSDEDAKKEIKSDYFDDFVDWKKERLKKEEEEESWRYEPEADESKVWKYEKEMAEEQAYENGLVIFKWPEDSDEIEVWLHSRHFDKARLAVRKSLDISMKDKDDDGEPVVTGKEHVSFTFVDQGSGEGKVMRAREV